MFDTTDREMGPRLRDYFTEAGFTRTGLNETLTVSEAPSHKLRNLARLLDKTSGDRPLDVLLRWFLVGVAVDRERAARIVPEWAIEGLLTGGLLEAGPGRLTGTAMLTPFEEALVASDHNLKAEEASDEQVVLGPNPTAYQLHRFTIRRPSRATFDFGCGSGIQALVAAPHSETVVASDLNPRATRFAQLNAWLNGFSNIECLTGDGFATVPGRTFDLIVANPPFLITPSEGFLFRDNPLELDGFSRLVAREAAARLNEGGYFQMITEWAVLRGESWQQRVSEWVQETGCDTLIFKAYEQEASRYAQDRIRELYATDQQGHDRRYNEWMEYYRQLGLEAVHGGVINLRRRPGTNWVRIQELTGRVRTPVGGVLEQLFANYDWLEAHPEPEQMAAAAPRLSSDLVLEEQCQPSPKGWVRTSLRLSSTTGLPLGMAIQPEVAAFLGRFDGTRTFGDLVNEFAASVQAPRERVFAECAGVARQLLERGVLLA